MEKETKSGKMELRKSVKKKIERNCCYSKCMNIQEASARASTSTESQTTGNPSLLLKINISLSVSYHDVPASDLVNQNCLTYLFRQYRK